MTGRSSQYHIKERSRWKSTLATVVSSLYRQEDNSMTNECWSRLITLLDIDRGYCKHMTNNSIITTLSIMILSAIAYASYVVNESKLSLRRQRRADARQIWINVSDQSATEHRRRSEDEFLWRSFCSSLKLQFCIKVRYEYMSDDSTLSTVDDLHWRFSIAADVQKVASQ